MPIDGLVIAFVILVAALLAAGFGLLTITGSLITALMALLLVLAWGSEGLIPAAVFFLLSSLWTRWPGRATARERRRTAWQVLANGLPSTLCAVAFLLHPWDFLLPMMAGGFAASAADTWGTEWGQSFGEIPVSLRSLRASQTGRSGSISFVGTLASFIGAGSVAFAGLLSGLLNSCEAWVVLYAGMFGGLVDSFAGAWFQGMWMSPEGEILEKNSLSHGSRRLQGIRWINNDVVNLFAAGAGVLTTGLIVRLWPM